MILQKNFAEREHFFAVRVLFCSIYVLFPRVLHEYGRITTVHERHVTEEVFMYSLWSNYIYIHRELWHYSKKPFLFQALEIVSQVLTGFFGILLPAGILLFLEQSSGFSGFALGTLVLFLCYAVVLSATPFCNRGTPGSIPNSGPAFLRAAFSVISCR